MTQTTYTLASLQQRQAELQKEIEKSQRRMSVRWKLLTAKPAERSGYQRWMTQVERSVVICDGVMTGYKIFRRFNAIANFFKRKKKRKK